jgi:hypothetical protein
MSRKLISVVAVLAFLSLSTAGTAQTRPLALHPVAPSGLFQDLSRWVSSGLADIWAKDGAAVDPNGAKHQATQRAFGPGRPAGRVGGEGK